jgi:hypothetical protein
MSNFRSTPKPLSSTVFWCYNHPFLPLPPRMSSLHPHAGPSLSSCVTTDPTAARAGEYQWARSAPLVPRRPLWVALCHKLPGVVQCSLFIQIQPPCVLPSQLCISRPRDPLPCHQSGVEIHLRGPCWFPLLLVSNDLAFLMFSYLCQGPVAHKVVVLMADACLQGHLYFHH